MRALLIGALSLTALLILAAAAYVAVLRFAPVDIARWHLDPAGAEDPGLSGVRLVGGNAPVFADQPAALSARIAEVLGGHPRATLVAGSVEDGHLTYLFRTKWLGFADFMSLKLSPAQAGTRLEIVSQSRIGGYDYGVNRARVDDLLRRLEAR